MLLIKEIKKKKMIKIEKKIEQNEKRKVATRGIEPRTAGLLSRSLAPRPRGKLDFGRKKMFQYDLWSQQIFVKILLTQETSTM